MQENVEVEKQPVVLRHLTMTYRGSGIDIESAGITVFDLWGLSVYLRVYANDISNAPSDVFNDGNRGVRLETLPDGEVISRSYGVSMVDCWSLSNFVKMRADEEYINLRTQERVREAAHDKTIEVAHGIPGPGLPNRETRRRRN